MIIKPTQYTLPDGRMLEIRSAVKADAAEVARHRGITASQTHFMAREPEDGQLNVTRLEEVLDLVEQNQRDFMVNAFIDGHIVGDLGMMGIRPHVKYLHRVYMGMSIQQDYWGCGLGSFMLQLALEQAAANGYEQAELGVYSTNVRAIHLYEKCGFKQYGCTPKAFKLPDGTYADEIIMVKFLQE